MKKEELIKKYPDLLKQIFNEFTNKSFDKGITWDEYLKENKTKVKHDFLVLGLRNKDNGNYYFNYCNQFVNPKYEKTKIPYKYGIEKYEITKVKHKEKEYTINDFVLVNNVCYMIKSFTINNDILICELVGCDIIIKKPISDLDLINKTPDFQVKCVKIPHYSELWLSDKTNHFCGIDGKNVIEYEKALLIGDIKSVVYKGIQYNINDVVDYNGKLYEIKSFDKEKVNLKERNGNYYYEPHISEISKVKPIGVSCDEFDIYLKDLVHWVDIKENYRYYYHSEMECFFFPQTAKIFKLKENALKFIEKNNPKVLFTTFDGVEIFLGDLYYYLDEDLNDYFIGKAIETSGKDKEFKYFSSKESLENYKLKHAKVLSYDDIKIYLSTKVNDDDNLILDLVKERLNGNT